MTPKSTDMHLQKNGTKKFEILHRT